jgi:hypothetical protein
MKRVILIAALVSGSAMAQMSYDIQPIQPIAPIAPIIPVAPVSQTGPTTVWKSGNYTYIEEPKGTTTVFQAGQFTYITPPNGGKQTMCQTIGQFVYCN